eukprot:TRINITY_DN6372_c1_g1_i1.p2 TRINITY_DN6372_c1_g1~~TRINITY_DN6372_c1_g1_i1.p2  ORF type:complete len:304 (+),score=78.48 TRINITY_DN6372_c1_g1_i1:84-914(+)
MQVWRGLRPAGRLRRGAGGGAVPQVPRGVLFDRVPGLVLVPDFLGPAEHDLALDAARRLSEKADALAASGQPLESPRHNLNQREQYVSLQLPVPGQGAVTCEHFRNYGDGHRLTYFRGNQNVPNLGLGDSLVARLGALPWVEAELREQRALRGKPQRPPVWRMTLNRYPAGDVAAPRTGFPWHRDLVANGASTMILALGSPGSLEFGRLASFDGKEGLRYADHDAAGDEEVEVLEHIELAPRGLLVLAGEARWKLLHRVVAARDGAERVSLVYGVW